MQSLERIFWVVILAQVAYWSIPLGYLLLAGFYTFVAWLFYEESSDDWPR